MGQKSKAKSQKPKVYRILGTKIDNFCMSEATQSAENFLQSDHQHYIVTPNPEIVLYAKKNSRYRSILNKASLSIPDGTGLIWASRKLYGSNGLKERVAGIDFMQNFLRNLSRKSYWSYKSYRLLLLGGRNNSAHTAARVLQKKFPNLKFYALGNEKSRHLKFIINEVIQPDCIFVALGAPKQELWIARNLKKFPSLKLAMGIGGALDMISGKTPRAPLAMRRQGIEWLWRLMLQPLRLRRIVNACVVFPLTVIFKTKH